jgi:excisionase family DNA binding protein
MGNEDLQERMLTTKEVASALGLSVMSVSRAAARKEIPATRFGNRWRFDRAALAQAKLMGFGSRGTSKGPEEQKVPVTVCPLFSKP